LFSLQELLWSEVVNGHGIVILLFSDSTERMGDIFRKAICQLAGYQAKPLTTPSCAKWRDWSSKPQGIVLVGAGSPKDRGVQNRSERPKTAPSPLIQVLNDLSLCLGFSPFRLGFRRKSCGRRPIGGMQRSGKRPRRY
jgi:hypothetical protein